jgi:hypothetical protein
MTEEQQKIFNKGLFDKQICGSPYEDICRYFFELGINTTVDKALEIVQVKSDKMYVHTLLADDTNGLFCFVEAMKEIKELYI